MADTIVSGGVSLPPSGKTAIFDRAVEDVAARSGMSWDVMTEEQRDFSRRSAEREFIDTFYNSGGTPQQVQAILDEGIPFEVAVRVLQLVEFGEGMRQDQTHQVRLAPARKDVAPAPELTHEFSRSRHV